MTLCRAGVNWPIYRRRQCVKLVVSDAHEGLKAAITKVLGATWQRCRVHLMRNAMAHAGKTQRRIVSAWIGTQIRVVQHSSVRPNEFPVGRQKLPVPLRREFSEIARHTNRLDDHVSAAEVPFGRNSLFFFPAGRELA